MQIQAADYPLQVEPAQVLGFDCGLGAGLRICIFFGDKTQAESYISVLKTRLKCSFFYNALRSFRMVRLISPSVASADPL